NFQRRGRNCGPGRAYHYEHEFYIFVWRGLASPHKNVKLIFTKECLTPLPTIGYTQSIQEWNGVPLYRTHEASQPSSIGENVMRHGEPLDGEKTVQIVHRIACVLQAFGEQRLLGITDLASTTGLPKSTTH